MSELGLCSRREADRWITSGWVKVDGEVVDTLGVRVSPDARIEIDQARLLVLNTAWLIDNVGAREARNEISMIKALVPTVHTNVCDRAMQVFGAMGLSPDTPLADHWTWGRALRFADGPDQVHLQTVARMEIRRSQAMPSAAAYLTKPERNTNN